VKLPLATLWLSSVVAVAATVPVTDSVSRALLQARDGDTVLLQGPRVFHERVVINKSIRLLGTNSPTIDADGFGTPLTVAAPDSEVRGLTIRNSGHDLTTFDSGVMITGRGAIVRDCRVENDGFGIYVRGVDDCVIERNEISGGKDLASASRGNGIHLWKTRRNRILNNVVHDKRDGMYFSYADDNLISGNLIWDTRFGIHYMYSHQNRLLTNSLTHNSVGATLMFSRQSLVEGNFVSANRRHDWMPRMLLQY
jgi:nitrous oxidase accessory protein